MDTAASDAPPVVFLHGLGGAAKIWAPQLPSFSASGFAPIALDLPGYGPRAPVSTLSFEQLADDLETMVADRALRRPVLVGHSLGGMVAQTALRRRPDGYRAAVLCCTSPAFGDPVGDFQRKFVADRLGPLDAGSSLAELATGIIDDILGPESDPEGRAIAIASMAAVPSETYRAAVRCIIGFDERGNVARIAIPVLCLSGENDRNAPPQMMERMASKIPDARYVCLPRVGHLPNLEAPAAFDAAVLEFLRHAVPLGTDRC
jgi:pimeloyl-ACP methyl ester carboxylesterase